VQWIGRSKHQAAVRMFCESDLDGSTLACTWSTQGRSLKIKKIYQPMVSRRIAVQNFKP